MLKKKMFALSAVFVALLLLMAFAPGAALRSRAFDAPVEEKVGKYNAKSILLVDSESGEELFSQNPAQRLQIASMVKIMTLNIIFEELEKGSIALDTPITVSPNASGMGGSQAFLDANAVYKADELIKSIIVASANDSCVAMAEHISGDVTSFVSRMNDKAQEWGMKDTNFANCTGLPDPDGYSTAADVSIMFRHLIRHKKFFDYANVWMYDLVHPDGRVTGLTNTNKLVRFYNGCDGGKTGFTKEALSCLAITAKRGDTRLVGVIIAAPDAKERNAETSRLLNYGFANFHVKKVISEETPIEVKAPVTGGKQDNVSVKPEGSWTRLMKKGEKAEFDYTVAPSTLKAPVRIGDIAGKIKITMNGQPVAEVNLIANENVKKAGYLDIVNRMINAW